MKKSDFLSLNTLIIILSAMLLGVIIGRICPQNIHIQTATFFHNIYIKLHPDSQKDTKTIIIDSATKDIPIYSGNNIFEKPQKKENKYKRFIKKVLHENKKENNNIDIFLYNNSN